MKKVCIVTTLKAPLHEVISFVNFHINVQVDHLMLFFDDPDDPAISHLEKYEQVTCIKCDSEYWLKSKRPRPLAIEDRQVANANNAFKFALKHNFEWIIHIDSDELLYPDTTTDVDVKGLYRTGIRGLLSKVPDEVDVVLFDVREAVPMEFEYNNIFSEIDLFKVPPSEHQLEVLQAPEYRAALFHDEYFRGHKSSKSAVRLSAPISSMGLSSPVAGGRSDQSAGESAELVINEFRALKLLHFDCCEFEAWKTKWTRRMDGTATASYMRPNRDLQLDEFRKIYADNPEKLMLMYKNMYFLPVDVKDALLGLGVLTHIRLDVNLFGGLA